MVDLVKLVAESSVLGNVKDGLDLLARAPGERAPRGNGVPILSVSHPRAPEAGHLIFYGSQYTCSKGPDGIYADIVVLGNAVATIPRGYASDRCLRVPWSGCHWEHVTSLLEQAAQRFSSRTFEIAPEDYTGSRADRGGAIVLHPRAVIIESTEILSHLSDMIRLLATPSQV